MSALATCEALIAWLTPDFHESLWTDQEVGFCVGRSVLIIPIRVGLNPYGFIGKYHALDGVGKQASNIAEEVVEILLGHDLTATRIAAPVVEAFAQANSFDDARRQFPRMLKIRESAWTPGLRDRLERAAKENDQIAKAFYGGSTLPEEIDRLVDRLRVSAGS